MRSTGSASPALAPVRVHGLELRRSVDAPDLPRIRRRPSPHVPAPATQDGDGVGQVELPLPVLVAHLGERLAEARVAETVDRGIDLADPPLLLRCVLVLDDLPDFAAGYADDPPVAGGVVEDGGEDRGVEAAALVAADQLLER